MYTMYISQYMCVHHNITMSFTQYIALIALIGNTPGINKEDDGQKKEKPIKTRTDAGVTLRGLNVFSLSKLPIVS